MLVLGGGRAALSQVRLLTDFGARVDVIAPQVVSELMELAVTHGHRVSIQQRPLSRSDEESIARRQYMLVLACTGDSEQDKHIARLASESGVLVSLPENLEVASPASFIVPAIRKRGHVKIAVSTDGLSAALSRALLERIETSLGSKIDKYVLFLEALRERLLKLDTELKGKNDESRQQILRRLSESEELNLAFQRENFEEALQLLERVIAEVKETSTI